MPLSSRPRGARPDDGAMVEGYVWRASGAPLTDRARAYRREETRVGLFGVFPIGAALDHEGQPRSRVPAV
jgi:hypothetical protein